MVKNSNNNVKSSVNEIKFAFQSERVSGITLNNIDSLNK